MRYSDHSLALGQREGVLAYSVLVTAHTRMELTHTGKCWGKAT